MLPRIPITLMPAQYHLIHLRPIHTPRILRNIALHPMRRSPLSQSIASPRVPGEFRTRENIGIFDESFPFF